MKKEIIIAGLIGVAAGIAICKGYYMMKKPTVVAPPPATPPAAAAPASGADGFSDFAKGDRNGKDIWDGHQWVRDTKLYPYK